MQLASAVADPAADGARYLLVAPATDPGLRIRSDILRPQRPERLPTDLVSAASIVAVAKRAGGHLEEVSTPLDERGLLGNSQEFWIGRRYSLKDRRRELVRGNYCRQPIDDPDREDEDQDGDYPKRAPYPAPPHRAA